MLKFLCLTVFLVGIFADEELYQKTNSTFVERIIGGNDAAVGQFPHHVSLRGNNGTKHFCGGAIIGKRFILTAAQCTQGERSVPKNVQVVVGARLISSGGTFHTLDKIVNHPNFDASRAANDVSVLRTAKDIVFTKLTQPIALPKNDIPAGDCFGPLFLSGWGKKKNGDNQDTSNFPDVLQWIKTMTLKRSTCFWSLGSPWKEISAKTICTNNINGIGACHGDSGSPLITDERPRVLVGVASWVIPCAQGRPDVFARVFSHLKFIRKVMEE